MPAETTTPRSQALAEAGISPTPAALPREKLLQIKQAAEAQVDEFFRKMGVPDPSVLTDEHGWRHLKIGSAEGRAGVVESDGDLYLRTEALIMALPSDKELTLPLMRELLELNIMGLTGAARLGIMDDHVFAVVTRPVTELRKDDFAHCIASVMSIADGLDDTLMAKYGGTAKKRIAPNKVAASTTKRKKK